MCREREEHTRTTTEVPTGLIEIKKKKSTCGKTKKVSYCLAVSLSVLSKGIRRVLSLDGFTDWSKVSFSAGLVDPFGGSVPESGFGCGFECFFPSGGDNCRKNLCIIS